MTGTKRCPLKVVPQAVLAARCCCPLFVPFWCCRGDVYFLRVTQIAEERRNELVNDDGFDTMQLSGRNI